MSDTQTPVVAPWGKWDRISLQMILAGGIVYALVVLIVGTVGVVAELVSGTRTLTLPVDVELPAAADSGTATLLHGSFDSAVVTVAELTPASAGLLTAGALIGVVTQLLVAASFVYLAWRLLRREPFLRSLTWAFIGAGAVLLIGTILAQALSGFGGWLVVTELGTSPEGESFWPMAMNVDLTPVGLAFVLMLVGCAFEYGQKLSRETAGLV